MDTDQKFQLMEFLNTQASTSIAGFLIIVISILAIYFQRKTTKQKASLDFLDRLSSDDHLIQSSKYLRDIYHDKNKSLELVATSDYDEYKKMQDKIDPILNYFEALSIGIKIGIYDKRTACLFRRKQIIHTFEYSEPYIKNIRKTLDNNKLFENIEWLAKCLSGSKIKRTACQVSRLF